MNGFASFFARRIGAGRGAAASTRTGVVIAVAGVALALAVMELTLCIVTGFKSEIRRKVMGFQAPVSVTAPYDVETGHTAAEFVLTPGLRRLVDGRLPAGARSVVTLRRPAIIKTDGDFAAVEVVFRGPGHDPAFEEGNLLRGRLPQGCAGGRDSIVISRSLARKLGIDTAARPYVFFFVDGEVRTRRATVGGVYCSDFSDYDDNIVYGSPALAAAGRPELVTSLDIEGVPEGEIMPLADTLQARLVQAYRAGTLPELHPVETVYQSGAMYFNWLELLDTNVVVIFVLMLCVAGFTLVSSLFIIILDRMSTIGLLRALGATTGTVAGIFVRVAMRLVGAGMVIGNLLGLGLALLQDATHLLPLDPGMYYLPYVPVQVDWWAMGALNLGTALAAWLILILPARLASRVQPGAVMRYE